MMPLLDNVLDDTVILLPETSFNKAFTRRGRKGLNIELQTLRGNLKHWKSKMIFCDSKIGRVEKK